MKKCVEVYNHRKHDIAILDGDKNSRIDMDTLTCSISCSHRKSDRCKKHGCSLSKTEQGYRICHACTMAALLELYYECNIYLEEKI